MKLIPKKTNLFFIVLWFMGYGGLVLMGFSIFTHKYFFEGLFLSLLSLSFYLSMLNFSRIIENQQIINENLKRMVESFMKSLDELEKIAQNVPDLNELQKEAEKLEKESREFIKKIFLFNKQMPGVSSDEFINFEHSLSNDILETFETKDLEKILKKATKEENYELAKTIKEILDKRKK